MALAKKNPEALSASTITQDSRASHAFATCEAEAQRKRTRTLAKQQQAAERIASATAQLASGINEAASAKKVQSANAASKGSPRHLIPVNRLPAGPAVALSAHHLYNSSPDPAC